jgi:hypothetical protein
VAPGVGGSTRPSPLEAVIAASIWGRTSRRRAPVSRAGIQMPALGTPTRYPRWYSRVPKLTTRRASRASPNRLKRGCAIGGANAVVGLAQRASAMTRSPLESLMWCAATHPPRQARKRRAEAIDCTVGDEGRKGVASWWGERVA